MIEHEEPHWNTVVNWDALERGGGGYSVHSLHVVPSVLVNMYYYFADVVKKSRWLLYWRITRNFVFSPSGSWDNCISIRGEVGIVFLKICNFSFNLYSRIVRPITMLEQYISTEYLSTRTIAVTWNNWISKYFNFWKYHISVLILYIYPTFILLFI